jgi:hypothetical protein
VQPTALQLSMSKKYLNPTLMKDDETEKEITLLRPSSIVKKVG